MNLDLFKVAPDGAAFFFVTAQDDRQQILVLTIQADRKAVIGQTCRIGDVTARGSRPDTCGLVILRHQLGNAVAHVGADILGMRRCAQDFHGLLGQTAQHLWIGIGRAAKAHLERPCVAGTSGVFAHPDQSFGDGGHDPVVQVVDQFIHHLKAGCVDHKLGVAGIGEFRVHRQVKARAA